MNIKQTWGGKTRSSNLELYRIICMLMIVAHHFVVNSGLLGDGGPMVSNPNTPNTNYLYLFGMWGKTGINCFLMITGYFMCTSTISLRKFIKLVMWVYTYNLVIYGILLCAGYESVNLLRLESLLFPVWCLESNFVSCFIMFYLTIPFWNILIHNMNKKQHMLLVFLLVGTYSILGNIPGFSITFNYVSWFGVLYLVASYIRLYPMKLFDNKSFWPISSFVLILLSMLSIFFFRNTNTLGAFYCVSDSNKFLALAISVSTFISFKNIKIPNIKLINSIGASTFGVLLIHANSSAMRQWLWKDTVDCIGHYRLPFWQLVGYSIGVVLLIFFTCIIIDRIRIKLLEEPFFKWYDKKPRFQKLTAFLTEENKNIIS